jgi:membrane protease YdiL (CAAX protease family)
MENATQVYYLIAASFIVYFIISYAYKILKIQNIEGALLTKKGLLLINIKHVFGIILFGVIYYLIIPEYKFLIVNFETPKLNTFFLFLAVVLISAILASTSVKKKLKSKTEISQYNSNQGWIYFIIRFVFLLSYEFFFRGILLFTLIETSGLFIAIIISTILYVLIHAFDSRAEILGAIPFGIILCLFSYYTNSIWAAFFIHITLSGVFEVSMFNHLTLKTYKS